MGARRAVAILAAIALAACGASEPADPGGSTGPTGATGPSGGSGPAPPVLVASGRAGPWTVELRSDRTLGTGIAAIAIHVGEAAGTHAPDVSVAFEAWRPATGMLAPVVSPPRPGTDGDHHVEVVLAEASPAEAGWSFTISVTSPGEESATVTFPGVPVVERRLAGTIRQPWATLVLGVRFDAGLKVGSNPVTVALHEILPGVSGAAPVRDATIHVEPVMPSMGHGSTGSVDPVGTGTPGVHAGALFFSMPGDWETTFTVSRGGVEAGRVVVAVYF